MQKSIKFLATISALIFIFCFFSVNSSFVYAMPYYDLQPQKLVVRASFSTEYSKSSEERKYNIMLAVNSINKTFIDVNGVFSFNKAVGERTEQRGYKPAKIIKNGEFTEGVGGGVCQVSTTLYNAALLAGLKIVEYHPHSLGVNYVSPSFDAMVNSGSADLKIKNNTHNPIIIYAWCNGEQVTVEIVGEPMKEKIERKSVVRDTIPYNEEVIYDEKGEYEDLGVGERRVLSYGKNGLKSEGYLIYTKGGKSRTVKIRSDKYAAINYRVVIGGKSPNKK